MRTIRVIYISPQARRRLTVRECLAVVVAAVLTALTAVGHVIVLLAGAVDALVTSRLGVPRIGYGMRRLAEVVRDTWKEEL